MNWYVRMNRAIDYMEANLSGTIDYHEISAIMCQSAGIFQRTFSIVTDMSVNDYLRRRRLTLAAFQLQNSRDKVIDIALKFGYESPEAFARAFKEFHGVSPMAARKEGTPLKSFPRLTFLLTVKGDAAMDYKIESKKAFTVYGIEGIFTPEDKRHLKDIPEFWQKSAENGKLKQLLTSTEGIDIAHAICQYRETADNTFPYMIFLHKTKESKTEGFLEVEVPAATWAIFKSHKHTQEETSGIIQNLAKQVYTEWLPTASYEKLDGYELELYFPTTDGLYYCETWIRVLPISD